MNANHNTEIESVKEKFEQNKDDWNGLVFKDGVTGPQLLAKAVAANGGVQVVEPEQETSGVYYLFNPVTGTVEAHQARNPRYHELLDFDNLIAMAVHLRDTNVEDNILVMHGVQAVEIVVDDFKQRDEGAILKLPFDRKFALLKALNDDEKRFTHKQFINLLHRDFRGAVDTSVVDAVRAVKIVEEMDSKQQVNDNTLSRRATAKANGTDQLPESIFINTPVYEPSRVPDAAVEPIEMLLEFDDEVNRFRFAPVTRDIEAAIQNAGEYIHQWLERELGTQDRIAVFHGYATAID